MSYLFHIENCFSTIDEIVALVNEDEPTAVFTFNQTKGRGQYGKTWIGKPDQNMAYSLAVKTSEIPISNTFLNYYTAITVRNFLANLTHNVVQIKWPNDIIMNGKKVCGILIEKKTINQNEYFIIGIGINVLQTDFSDLPKAGSILSATGFSFELKAFASRFHRALIRRFANISSENQILEDYNRFLFRKDQICVFQIAKMRQNGIIKSADSSGFLWIELENEGLQKFFHKEVEMLY
ncbi:MAG: biotin--[acetyl-CoA-carboxylase] ligase [Weeksellaceae bacterium]|nr:biotin--[acetyl-CoA-carboxylase] ligase [Weeksellaceae bacterium]